MRTSVLALLALLVVGIASCLVISDRWEGTSMDALNGLLRDTALKAGYVPATRTDMERAEDAFARLLRGERGAAVARDLERLGFALEELGIAGTDHAVVREAPGGRAGKGLFIIAPPGRSDIALQAPHRFKDLYTGRIAAGLLAQGGFAAAAWNTVPRWYEEDGRRVDADMAHTDVSHFNAFTRAFGRVHPGGLVVQLHGFDQGARTTEEAAGADIIASGGVRSPGPRVRRHAACLKAAFPWDVRLYPDQVRELGGTTNANAAALRAVGSGEFLHLEMARPVRKALAEGGDSLRVLATCLLGGRP